MMINCIEHVVKNGESSGFSKKNRVQLQSSGVVNGWSRSKILSLLLGCFVIFISLGMFAGGGVILWSQSANTADDGYVYAGQMRLNADSYAVIDNEIHPEVENGWRPFTIKEVVSIKVKATSNNGKPVFIGVATKQSALPYFVGVNVDKLVLGDSAPKWHFDYYPTLTYQSLPGGSPQTPPTSQHFWTAQASGSGAQTLTWTPSTGDYWLVVMNADGSKVLDANVQIGVRLDFFSWTGVWMILGGIILALGGVAIIYFGVIRRH
jgi:hypothetical protein